MRAHFEVSFYSACQSSQSDDSSLVEKQSNVSLLTDFSFFFIWKAHIEKHTFPQNMGARLFCVWPSYMAGDHWSKQVHHVPIGERGRWLCATASIPRSKPYPLACISLSMPYPLATVCCKQQFKWSHSPHTHIHWVCRQAAVCKSLVCVAWQSKIYYLNALHQM